MSAVVWVHLAATLYLLGLIWCIQVVHYPLMDSAQRARFVEFHQRHGIRISLVVVAPMVIELLSAGLLVAWVPQGVPLWLPLTGAALVAVIWISTFAVQVPLHRKLSEGFDESAHRRLVASNWVRTAAWSVRSILALWIAVISAGH